MATKEQKRVSGAYDELVVKEPPAALVSNIRPQSTPTYAQTALKLMDIPGKYAVIGKSASKDGATGAVGMLRLKAKKGDLPAGEWRFMSDPNTFEIYGLYEAPKVREAPGAHVSPVVKTGVSAVVD